MSESKVAYLETTKVTHIVIWAEDQWYESGTDAKGFTVGHYLHAPVTLCGKRKRSFTSRARVLYTMFDEQPRYPLCKMCTQIADDVQKLAEMTSPVVLSLVTPKEDGERSG